MVGINLAKLKTGYALHSLEYSGDEILEWIAQDKDGIAVVYNVEDETGVRTLVSFQPEYIMGHHWTVFDIDGHIVPSSELS